MDGSLALQRGSTSSSDDAKASSEDLLAFRELLLAVAEESVTAPFSRVTKEVGATHFMMALL